jgi:hypothetical protein
VTVGVTNTAGMAEAQNQVHFIKSPANAIQPSQSSSFASVDSDLVKMRQQYATPSDMTALAV